MTITRLNTDKLTYVGQATGQVSVALPSSFEKLYMSVTWDNNSCTFMILREMLSSTAKLFTSGGYLTSQAFRGAIVDVDTTYATMRYHFTESGDKTSLSTLKVWVQ